jgi:hypothetical protein
MFTTKPKNKEIFVGDSVMFDWDYRKEEPVKYISFGIVTNGSEGPQEETLLRKQADGLLYTNNKRVFKELIPRIKAVEKSRASFNISNVRMNDTGKYFCTMEKENDIRRYTEYVNLKVVGKWSRIVVFSLLQLLNRREEPLSHIISQKKNHF